MKNRKSAALSFLVAGVVLIFFATMLGQETKGADSAGSFVSKNDVINGDYIKADNMVDVAGTVNGDVMVAGGSVNFSGRTPQDVLVAGGNVKVQGDVGGNVRAMGGNILVQNRIAKNVTLMGGNVVLDRGSTVSGNLYVAGGLAEIRGDVRGSSNISGGQVIIDGTFGRNVEITSEQITIRPDARINGDLIYHGTRDISVPNNVVRGKITRVPVAQVDTRENRAAATLFSILFELISLLIVAYVFYRLFTAKSEEVFIYLQQHDPWRNLAFGIIMAIVIPIVSLILIVTVVGMPLGFILLFGFAVALILSKILAYIMMGHYIRMRMKKHEFEKRFPLMDFILGFVVITVIGLIPVLGWIVVTILTLWAFGGLAGHIRARRMAKREDVVERA